MTLKELREKRAGLVKEMRAVVEKARAEKRDLAAEEEAKFTAINTDIDKLGKEIEREERLAALEAELRQVPADRQPDRPNPENRGEPSGSPEERAKADAEKRMVAFRRFILGGLPALTEPERRALQADVSTEGGYTVPPQEFVASLLKNVDDMVAIRALATKQTITMADSLGVPTLDTDVNDADWTSELATGIEDTAMRFGKRELRPHPLAKRIKISKTLLRKSALSIEQIVRDRLGYKFGVTEEKAFMTGNGSQRPLGLFIASTDGIPTSRDVSTDNTTTAIGADNLINVKYFLKSPYWARARWLFHRDAVRNIRKLKDTQNQYLWQPGLQAGAGDRILDLPIIMSEHVPNTFTTGLYVGMLADFSYYWIADALSMQLDRLNELYAETNQVGFIGRLEVDGMPALAEAFVRVKLA